MNVKPKVEETDDDIRERPSLTVDDRQNRLIALATDCAERQLREGTASSQVIVHYLKLGTIQAKLECEKLENENELLKAKRNAIESSEKSEAMYKEAMEAFRSYSGGD